MKTITHTKLWRGLNGELDRLCVDHEPVLVKRRGGKAVVLMSLAAYSGFEDTLYLLSEPANAERLRKSLAEAAAGLLVEHEIIEPN